MTKRRILYILLVLGLLAIGSGAWLIYNPATEDIQESNPVTIRIPDGEPVIYEQVCYLMRGENYELYIYGDGSIIYIEEKGLRLPMPGHPATRTWSTGNFTIAQVNSLLAYLENSGLNEMEDSYNFPGEPTERGSISMSDMNFTIIVNSENLSRKVTAFGYLSPDNGETYPDMPSPLNDIYGRLRSISEATEEVCHEDIRD